MSPALAPVLEDLDVDAAYRWLRRYTDARVVEWVDRQSSHPHDRCALLFRWAPPSLLSEARAVAFGERAVSRADAAAVDLFLFRVGRVWRPFGELDGRDHATVVEVAGGERRGLVVDAPLIDRLPLLDLAADVAAHERSGTLVVTAGSLVGSVAGIATRVSSAALVVIDVDIVDSSDLGDVFAHELSHLLDPAGIHGVPHVEAERFADDLARLLVEHCPASVAAAAPLVAAVLDGRNVAGLPTRDDDLDAVLWFLTRRFEAAV